MAPTPFRVVGTVDNRALGAGAPVVYVQLADAQRANDEPSQRLNIARASVRSVLCGLLLRE